LIKVSTLGAAQDMVRQKLMQKRESDELTEEASNIKL
jgi:hypothetical protein